MTLISLCSAALIFLVDQLGNPVIVRADLIATTHPSGSDTAIALVTGQKITVRQSPAEIRQLTENELNSDRRKQCQSRIQQQPEY